MSKRVVVGMSGGVDSTVSALILKNSGYDVVGAWLRMTDDVSGFDKAKSVCDMLDIPLYMHDMRDVFNKNVVTPFIDAYVSGKTPNPCIICNPTAKIKGLEMVAEINGAQKIATGHYANLGEKDGRFFLIRDDNPKDQTYFLYRLTQKQLSKLIFPLYGMEKSKVKQLATDAGFHFTAEAKESQEICFIPDDDYISFIKMHTDKGFECGDFVDIQGNILGKHSGIASYTVGQRKGLGIALGKPAYVIKNDPILNTVTLGDNDDLFSCEVNITDAVYMSEQMPDVPTQVFAKIRYAAKPEKAVWYPMDEKNAKIIFEKPQRAVTSGQSLVAYIDNMLFGGGFIV